MLALIPLRPMRELALVLSAGILLDTFVVRSILVPSLLALFRREQRERRPRAPYVTLNDPFMIAACGSHTNL